MKNKILVVENETICSLLIKSKLEKKDYEVLTTPKGGEAIDLAKLHKPDLILMDVHLKDELTGIDAAIEINKFIKVPIIFLTAYSDEETINQIKDTNPFGLLIKPVEDSEMVSAIEIAIQKTEYEKKLLESEERYKALFNHSLYSIFICDFDGKITDVNNAIVDLTGFSSKELKGKSILDFISPVKKEFIIQTLEELKQNKSIEKPITFKLERKDGEIRYVEVSVSSIIKDGYPYAIQGVLRDFTEKIKLENDLRESEDRLRTLVGNIPGILYQCKLNVPWRIYFISEEIKNLCGRPAENFINGLINYADIVLPEDLKHVQSVIEEAINNKEVYLVEYRLQHVDGSVRIVLEQGKAKYDSFGEPKYLEGVVFDITKKRKVDALFNHEVAKGNLYNSEKEKLSSVLTKRIPDLDIIEERLFSIINEEEISLKEIHKRIKNNLQVILNFLSLQDDFISDSRTLPAFKENKIRVKVIALLLEELNTTTDLENIESREYFSNIINYLVQSFNQDNSGIEFEIAIDNVNLSIEKSIPLSLILNELLLNIFKHAFPENLYNKERKTVRVNLTVQSGHCVLLVKDNGKGLDKSVDVNNPQTFGLYLVNYFAKQLKGKIEFENNNGLLVKITFTLEKNG